MMGKCLASDSSFNLSFAFDLDPQLKVIHLVVSCRILQKDIILWHCNQSLSTHIDSLL